MKFLCALVLFSLTSVSPAFAESQAENSYFDKLMSAAHKAVVVTIASTLANQSDGVADQHITPDKHSDPSEDDPSEDDPLEKYNRMMFRFNSALDTNALQPLAENYRDYTPELVQTGVRNFFSNLGEVGVVTNSVLQGKLDQALNDSTRLAINTVAGIGGVIDVATMLDFKKNREDFGQTFGVWGIPEGPYIVLPVLGPRTLRSAVGTAFDTYLQVETLGAVGEVANGTELINEMLALNLVSQRAQMLGKTELLEQAALDPYIFAREAYLAFRRCQVVDCDQVDYQPAGSESLLQQSPEQPDALDELDALDEPDALDELDQLDGLDRSHELEIPSTIPDELDLLDDLHSPDQLDVLD